MLLLAPGNSKRVAGYGDFVDQPIYAKAYNFLIGGTFTNSFANYGLLFVIFGLIIILLIFVRLSTKEPLIWAITFFVLGIMANAAFIVSPVVELRSLQGTFVFFLISLSFLTSTLMSEPRNRIINIVIGVSMTVGVAIFTLSYTLETVSFNLARHEFQI